MLSQVKTMGAGVGAGFEVGEGAGVGVDIGVGAGFFTGTPLLQVNFLAD